MTYMPNHNEPKLNLHGVIDVQIPIPYALTYQIIPATSKEEEHIHMDMLYHLEANEDDVKPQLSEVSGAAWHTKKAILYDLETFDAVRSFAELELR